ncbi:hypothetical protein K3495_g6122 [Podosphaera aphanis]|nr:hypothetical protein K3495_g6122 [Podosphaera aphanis]
MAGDKPPDLYEVDIYRRLDEYGWDQDKEFQGGLSAILGPNPISTQIYDLTLRAKCFYLARKLSISISFDGYKSYLLSKEASAHGSFSSESSVQASLTLDSPRQSSSYYQTQLPSAQATPDKPAPYPTNFAQIIELITSGSPIPGIREIPSTVVPEKASIPKAPKRKKPWENSLTQDQINVNDFGDREENMYLTPVDQSRKTL